MLTGSLTINGVDDKGLITIFQVKEKHEARLQLNPQQMQSAMQGNPPKQFYNNVVLSWNSEGGIEAVKEILHRLTTPTA